MEFLIKRPVLCIIMSLIIIALGTISFSQLKLRQYPRVINPILTVSVKCNDLNTEAIETQVVELLESNFAALNGLKQIESTTSPANTRIKIEFDLNTDLNLAFIDAVAILNKLKLQLPDKAEVSIIKTDVDSTSLITICATSDVMSIEEVKTSVENNLKSHLLSVPGVAIIDIHGATKNQMKVFIDPKKIAMHKIEISEIIEQIQNTNVQSLSSGHVTKKENRIKIKFLNLLKNEKDFDNIIIGKTANAEGIDSLIKLKDVGYTKYTNIPDSDVKLNGKKIILISVVPQPNASLIKVSKEVQVRIKEVQEKLGKKITFSVFEDKSIFVKESIDNVYKSIVESIILVIITILLFLRSFRSSIIPIVVIPICLIGTFSIMQICGFTINVLTLLALVLSMGIVVDDAIVVLENIHRYIEKEDTPLQASIKGFKEILFSVIAMTLTLCAVYLPVTLVPGITGKIFTEFAITLAGSVLISGFVAVTLSPVMCAYILKKHEKPTHFIAIFLENIENKIQKSYSIILNKIFDMKKFIIGGLFLTAIVSLFMIQNIPSILVQESDTGYIDIYANTNSTYNLKKNVLSVDTLTNAILKQVNGVDQLISLASASDSNQLLIKVKKNKKSAKIAEEINKIINKTPLDLNFDKAEPQSDQFMSSGSKQQGDSQFSFNILTHTKNQKDMIEASQICRNATQENESIEYANWNLNANSEEKIIMCNYDKAWTLGVTNIRGLFSLITKTIGGYELHNRFQSRDEGSHPILLSVGDVTNLQDTLNHVKIKAYQNNTNQHKMIPLSAFLYIKNESNPESYRHINGLRSVTIYGKIKKNADLYLTYKNIKNQIQNKLPDGYYISPSKNLKTFLEESNIMLIILLLALLFIYLIMAGQFESFISPLIIMMTVPFSIFGAIFTLYITGNSFNMFSNIGIITLIGLITRHGILIVDFADKLYASGSSIKEAIIQSCITRLRPILMTTFAMILGATPLILSTGAGSEAREQLGLVIVGGMSIGTIFTLIALPLIYYFIKKTSIKFTTINNNISN